MKKFRIGLYEEIGGYSEIEAKDKKEARAKAQQILDDDGVEGFKDFDSTHRETTILDVEEVK
jgi:hypothetical protein